KPAALSLSCWNFDWRQNLFELRARGFQARRQTQLGAELFNCFIQCEARRLGSDLEKISAWFPEINRMKVSPIDHWSHVVAEFDQMRAPFQLLGIILRAKGDMMHRPGGDQPRLCVGQAKQIDHSTWRSLVRRCKAKPVSRLVDQTITETLCE